MFEGKRGCGETLIYDKAAVVIRYSGDVRGRKGIFVSMRICKSCGFHAEHQEKFCPKCGAEIVDVVDKKNADSDKSEEKERSEETVEPEETEDPKEATEPVEAEDLDLDSAPASEKNTPNIQVPDVETAATMMGMIEDTILGQTKGNIDEMFGGPISSDDYNIFTYDGSYMIDEGGRLKAYFVEARAYRVDYLFGGSSASDFTEDMALQALTNMYGSDYTEMVNDAQQIEYDWNYMNENKTQGASEVKLVSHGDPAGLLFEVQWFAIG